MRAYLRPLNAQSIAAGLSEPPALPREFVWVALTARVNHALGSNYKKEELQAMPLNELLALSMWVEATVSAPE